jgi:hypothetical protein
MTAAGGWRRADRLVRKGNRSAGRCRRVNWIMRGVASPTIIVSGKRRRTLHRRDYERSRQSTRREESECNESEFHFG